MPELHERVVVLAPTGRDAELIEGVLRQDGFNLSVCGSFDELLSLVEQGAGVAVIAEEGMPPGAHEELVRWIEAQPAWSDLPLVLLTTSRSPRTEVLYEVLGDRANLRLLERPLGSAVLRSAVRSAVRERRRQYEVRSLLVELRAEHDRKDDFIAVLGHEVRNPLAAIKAAVQLLQRKRSEPQVAERMGEVIERQLETLDRLVGDLVETSRLTRGKIVIEKQQTDLKALVAQHLRGIHARTDTHDRIVTAQLPQGPLMGEVDAVRVEQVLANLLTNALKFTPKEGRVHVALRREGDEAVLEVTDEGIGMEQHLLERIFEPFSQADPNRGGLGLGLALVRGLVEMHGGTIDASSEGPGRGSRFVVRLPLEGVPSLEQSAAF